MHCQQGETNTSYLTDEDILKASDETREHDETIRVQEPGVISVGSHSVDLEILPVVGTILFKNKHGELFQVSLLLYKRNLVKMF